MIRSLVALLVLVLCAPAVQAQDAPTRGTRVSARRDAEPTAERRIALVIGNDAYAEAPLNNPGNDARDMAAALAQLGFEVDLKVNLTQVDMKKAVRDFGQQLRRERGTGLFFFAGHGIQADGRNYLVPVDAEITHEEEVEYETIDAGFVLAQMEAAENPLNIVILDACRNNPYARSFRSASRGLASIDAPVGTIIAYATAPGSIASDGTGRNGLYTQELLRYMRTPGLSVEDVFKRVRIAVRQESDGSQIPWESSSLTGDFYFSGQGERAPDPEPPVVDIRTEGEAVEREPAPPRVAVTLAEAEAAYNAGDHARAATLYLELAAGGNAEAQNVLGNLYYGGEGVAQDHLQAVAWYRLAAEQGNALAQRSLGAMYFHGFGVAKDLATSFQWFKRAAEQGLAEAQNQVGNMYHNGEGVAQGYAEALSWYRKAADQGNDWGQRNVGWMYQNGFGTTQDAVQAFNWYQKAAKQNNLYAFNDLGNLYYAGLGVPKDLALAAHWYRQAAEAGIAEAQTSLGHLYFRGEGVAQDFAQAAAWYRQAADQGNANGQYSLGYLYHMGQGVAQDLTEAVRLYERSAAQGNTTAQEALRNLKQ